MWSARPATDHREKEKEKENEKERERKKERERERGSHIATVARAPPPRNADGTPRR